MFRCINAAAGDEWSMQRNTQAVSDTERIVRKHG